MSLYAATSSIIFTFVFLAFNLKKIALVSVLFCGNFSAIKLIWYFLSNSFSLTFFSENNKQKCKRLKFTVSGKVAVRCGFYSFHPMIS